MRLLLMVLLLANLGFFAWQQWYDPERVAGLPPGEVGARMGAGLQLVGEQQSRAQVEPVVSESVREEGVAEDASPGAAPAEEGSDEEVLTEIEPQLDEEPLQADATCATLGPFEQLDMAQVAEERLESYGSPATIRESGGQIRSGFWVYLPPYSSRSEAKRVEDELRGKNVSDLFIVTGSDQRNAISLGLFSTPERADQRAAEIGRLGYTPRVAERFRDATVYWVDFRERPGDPLDPQRIGVMGASDVLPEKRNIPCEDIAVDSDAA